MKTGRAKKGEYRQRKRLRVLRPTAAQRPQTRAYTREEQRQNEAGTHTSSLQVHHSTTKGHCVLGKGMSSQSRVSHYANRYQVAHWPLVVLLHQRSLHGLKAYKMPHLQTQKPFLYLTTSIPLAMAGTPVAVWGHRARSPQLIRHQMRED